MPTRRVNVTHPNVATTIHAPIQAMRDASSTALSARRGGAAGSPAGSVGVMVLVMSVRAGGLEPPLLAEPGPKPGASAYSATPAGAHDDCLVDH